MRSLLALTALGCLLATPAAQGAEVGYKGGFFIDATDSDSSYLLTIQGRVQSRFTLLVPDEGDDEFQFSIPRARLTLKGHFLTKDLQYKLQTDFGKGGAALKDFYVDYAFMPALHLRVGQGKRPFSRQQITSSGRLASVDRAITDKAFGAGRDIGLMLHNSYDKSPEIEWALGVFNGTGDKGTLSGTVVVDPATGEGEITKGGVSNVPDQLEPVIVGHLGYNTESMYKQGYDEADFHPEAGLRFGVATSVLFDLGVDDDESSLAAELDFIMKLSGLTATGAFFVRALTSGDDSGLEALGFHVQAGYVIDGMIQPVVRFATVLPDDDTAPDTREIAAGLAVYFHEHVWKWDTEVAALQTSGDSTATDWRVQTQLQASF